MSHTVPADTIIATSGGPVVAGQLHDDVRVMIIDRTGKVGESALEAVRAVGDRPAVRVLTDIGDPLLDEDAIVTTRAGRLFARDLARQIKQGARQRIELARASELPQGDPPDKRGSYRACLALFDPPVIRVPRELGQEQAIARILEVAGVTYANVSDERWTALRFDPEALAAETAPPSIHDLALLTMTAWRTEGTLTMSRTTLEQSALRRRLLAALVCARTPGNVQWVPAYKPVEARVTPGETRSYTTTRVAVVESLPAVELSIVADGSLISDLVIVAPRLAASPRP